MLLLDPSFVYSSTATCLRSSNHLIENHYFVISTLPFVDAIVSSLQVVPMSSPLDPIMLIQLSHIIFVNLFLRILGRS